MVFGDGLTEGEPCSAIFHGAILLTFVVAPPLCHHWAPFTLDFEGSLHPRQMRCIGAVLRLAREGKMMMALGGCRCFSSRATAAVLPRAVGMRRLLLTSGDTGHDQSYSDFLPCFLPKVLHAVHVLCCLNQVTQSDFGIGKVTQVAAEGECFLHLPPPPASGQVRPLVRFEAHRASAWQGSAGL